MRTRFAVLLVAGFCFYAEPALAQLLTIPNTFVSGTPAKAEDVNANFTAVATAVNSLGSAPTLVNVTGCGTSCPSTAQGSSSVAITVNQISITTTGAGQVVVDFNGSVQCFPVADANQIEIIGQLNSPTGLANIGDGSVLFRLTTTVVGAFYESSMNARRVFTVPAAGSYTYYYNANNINGGGGTGPASCTFYGGNMTAMFFPT